MVCRTSINGTFETGQSAVRIDLVEREGDKAARLQLFLPVGLYLQAGVKITIDQGTPYRIPYVWCLTNTCIAGNLAEPSLLKGLESGKTLLLEVVDSSLLTVSTSASDRPVRGGSTRDANESLRASDRRVTKRQAVRRSDAYASPAEACSSGSISDFAENGFVR